LAATTTANLAVQNTQ